MPLAGLPRGGAGVSGPAAGQVGGAAKGSQLGRGAGGVGSPNPEPPQAVSPSAPGAVGAEPKLPLPLAAQPMSVVRPVQARPPAMHAGIPGGFMPAGAVPPAAVVPPGGAAPAGPAQQQNAAAWAWYMAMYHASANYAAMHQQYTHMMYAGVPMQGAPQLPRVVVHPGGRAPTKGPGGADAKRRREGEAGAPRDGKGRKKTQGEGGAAGGSGDPPVAKVCSNCGTSRTPFWRKDKVDGQPLCNACGLYSAKNDAPRPAALWKAPTPAADKKPRESAVPSKAAAAQAAAAGAGAGVGAVAAPPPVVSMADQAPALPPLQSSAACPTGPAPAQPQPQPQA